jgi:hypothetical protein
MLDPEDRGITVLQNIKNTHPTAQCHFTQDVNLHAMHSLCSQLLFVIVSLFVTVIGHLMQFSEIFHNICWEEIGAYQTVTCRPGKGNS